MIRRNPLVLAVGVLLTLSPRGILVLATFPEVQEQTGTEEKQPPRKKETGEPIDINRASVEEFAKLPGIGPELGRRIVAFREEHGPFRRVEDLLAIRGIGRKKWKAIRPFIRVGNEAENTKTMNDER